MHAKKLVGVLIAVCFWTLGTAQTRAGLKGGIFTFDINAAPLIITDEGDTPLYSMSISKSKLGIHAGLFVLAEIGHFFVEPELSFHTHTIDYILENLQDPSNPVLNRDESYNYLDFPLMLGLKFGPVRFGGGALGHLFLNSNSDVLDLEGYEQNFNALQWGWQALVAIDTWKFHCEVKYEENFQNFGSHISFYGNSYVFGDKPSRIIVSIGISF